MQKIWEEEKKRFGLSKHKLKELELKGFCPFMISDIGELICIPNLKDSIVLCLAGTRRVGKSRTLLALLSSFYWGMGTMCCHLNDMTDETYNWRGKADEKTAETFEGLRTRKSIPLVHVLLNSKSMQKKKSVPKWITCLSFEEVLDNPHVFMPDLGASINYFIQIKDYLKGCKTMEDVKEVISEKVTGDKKISKTIVAAIMSRLAYLNESRMLSLHPSNVSSDTQLVYENETYDIIPGLMMTGSIPVLHTNHIIDEPFFFQYLGLHINKIIQAKLHHPFFKGKRIMCFVDELTGIADRNKTNPLVKRLVVQGGPLNIGTVWATQNPSEVEKAILTNTGYFIMFSNKTSEIKILTSELGISKRWVDEIRNLKKEYNECVAYTKEYFVAFNPKENSYRKMQGPIRGMYLCSGSGSKPPS